MCCLNSINLSPMTSIFVETLKPFLTISKIFGLLNICCTMKTGLLCRSTDSTYYLFLEVIRTFIFLITSYHVMYNMGMYNFIQKFNVIQYWMLLITSRISEHWTIEYVELRYLIYFPNYAVSNIYI